MVNKVVGQGTAQDPWVLKASPGTSDYTMHTDEASDRFGRYVPPLMEALGLVELAHSPRGNRMRAI